MPPRVSLGLVVYNGERYLAEAIESLLAQTYRDFELILSDNASTDGTQAICEKYARLDPRIRYVRSPVNVGASGNFNRTVELARGVYFKWVAHDDVFRERFLERCVEELDRDPGLAVCSTDLSIIGADGRIVQEEVPPLGTDTESTHRRFRALLFNGPCYEMVSTLMRTDVVRAAGPVGSYAHSDGIILARIGLRGRFRMVPERLFLYREHAGSSHQTNRTFRDYVVFFDPAKAGKILFPRWRMGFEHARSVVQAPIPLAEKMRCSVHLLRWVRVSWKGLVANIFFGGVQFAARVPLLRRLMGRLVTAH